MCVNLTSSKWLLQILVVLLQNVLMDDNKNGDNVGEQGDNNCVSHSTELHLW
jgi:hypothetical protein